MPRKYARKKTRNKYDFTAKQKREIHQAEEVRPFGGTSSGSAPNPPGQTRRKMPSVTYVVSFMGRCYGPFLSWDEVSIFCDKECSGNTAWQVTNVFAPDLRSKA